MPTETRVAHLVKSEDLNHHGTLFAGRMSEWVVEACYISAARLIGNVADVVCVQVHSLVIARPAVKGDIVELRANIALLGETSITVHGAVFKGDDEKPIATGWATFVTINSRGRARAHGKELSSRYVKLHRDIHAQAKSIRAAK
jgi:acyl-CoA hydrolase